MNTSDSTRQRKDMAHYKHLMTAPSIESSTREERLDYVLNEWKCLHNCELCGKCHVLKGRSEEREIVCTFKLANNVKSTMKKKLFRHKWVILQIKELPLQLITYYH